MLFKLLLLGCVALKGESVTYSSWGPLDVSPISSLGQGLGGRGLESLLQVPGGCCRIRGTRLCLLWETFRTWMRPLRPVVGAPGRGVGETVRPPLRPAPEGRLPALRGRASCFRSFPAGTVLCGAGGWESPREEASSRSPCTTSLNQPSKLKFHISYACLFRLCKTEMKINISFRAY